MEDKKFEEIFGQKKFPVPKPFRDYGKHDDDSERAREIDLEYDKYSFAREVVKEKVFRYDLFVFFRTLSLFCFFFVFFVCTCFVYIDLVKPHVESVNPRIFPRKTKDACHYFFGLLE